MTNERINALKNSFDLREIASEYTTLKGGNEQYGACPVCGGEDRFHVQEHMFFCRECKPMETGRHDIIDFLIWVGESRDFKSAITYLESRAGTTTLSPVRQKATNEPRLNYHNGAWQKNAIEYARIAHERLPKELQGLQYLQTRGIHTETWKRAKLGFAVVRDSNREWREAISIPWFLDRQIVAIQNRIIKPEAEKYTRYGSGGYYGTSTAYIVPKQPQTDRLVIVEGEINALSIAQTIDINVISIGSQNWGKPTVEELKRQIEKGQYKNIYLWLDEESQAKKLKEQLEIDCTIINSQLSDANDLLRDNQLKNLFNHYFDQLKLM